jgi:hypothetical protein|uniref:hypothetical protein n=1 Tax=Shewanella sp. TaxID=50422 RepID=UPI0040488E17
MSTNSSNSSKGEGNNISSPSKQISAAVSWCFTFNNYSDEIIQKFQSSIKEKCKLGFFNKEVGKSGTPHLQGYIEFLKKSRPLKIFPDGAHWSKAKGNKDANFKYCSKDAMDTGMSFIYGYKIKPVIKVIKELRPFQKDIEDILLGPVNDGKIIWVYDEEGQLGKTELLRYLYVKYQMPFTYGGKASDIVNLVFNHKDYLLDNDKAVMIYNFGRDVDNDKISYKSMEQISDGCISNNKFETGCFICNKPHVLVLANCLPKMSAMTSSRWIIKTINKDSLTLEDYNGYDPLDEL